VIPESLIQRKSPIRVFARAGTREIATRELTFTQGERVSVIVM
jgi:hypothetical protein